MKLKSELFCVVFLLPLLFGCGRNDSTSSNPTPSIIGSYKLSSAKGNYADESGFYSFDLATSITGTLIIGQESWDETFVVDGTTYSKNGTYDINYTNGTVEGTIDMAYQNGVKTYSFSIEGYNLNLTGYPNSTWTKVSN